MKKRVMVVTGGGDCPGLNAVIRAIVKRASQEEGWEVIGSIQSFNGVLKEPEEIIVLDEKTVAGIHFRGGTIIGTTNKGGPFDWPVKKKDGTWTTVDKSDDMLKKLKELGVEAVISIGGDGSQKISYELYKKGLNIVGVPKTIDNDLSSTEYTFGFQTAVQIATESVDKLVTTAASHNRVFIMEVMGRDAGWIALYSSVGGGAEVCIIPEIPYDPDKIVERLKERFNNGKGFALIVVAEGAKRKGGDVYSKKNKEVGYENPILGGVAYKLAEELKESGCEQDIRVTVLGHLQRGGTPVAFDRILATEFGVKAFELVLDKQYGEMVSVKNSKIISVPIEDAIANYKFVSKKSYLVHTAKSVGICFGD
jgi:6-phosphofructokinase 1